MIYGLSQVPHNTGTIVSLGHLIYLHVLFVPDTLEGTKFYIFGFKVVVPRQLLGFRYINFFIQSKRDLILPHIHYTCNM